MERPLLDATLPAAVAHVLARDCPEAVRHLEAKGQALAMAGQREVGVQFLRSVALIREASRQWRELQPARQVAGRPPPAMPPRLVGISSAKAGEILDVTARQATNLAEAGVIVGAKVKGRWVIDELSVRNELERRRSV